MKNTLFLTAFLFLLGTSLTAQSWGRGIKGEGPKVQKELQIKSFEGVKLSLPANVQLIKGSNCKVVVDAQQNIIDAMDIEVRGGILTIGSRKNLRNHASIDIQVTLPKLRAVKVSGSGDVESKDHFSGLGDVDIAVSGSGNIRLDIDAKRVDTKISGSGNIELKGNAVEQEVRISGSGNYRSYELQSSDCSIAITGSGDAKVHVKNKLDAKITGSGDISYKGSPDVRSKILGSGDVRSRGK
ncbi:MAG: head GIN domain-containing protein [Bacteroidota bacterium]